MCTHLPITGKSLPSPFQTDVPFSHKCLHTQICFQGARQGNADQLGSPSQHRHMPAMSITAPLTGQACHYSPQEAVQVMACALPSLQSNLLLWGGETSKGSSTGLAETGIHNRPRSDWEAWVEAGRAAVQLGFQRRRRRRRRGEGRLEDQLECSTKMCHLR